MSTNQELQPKRRDFVFAAKREERIRKLYETARRLLRVRRIMGGDMSHALYELGCANCGDAPYSVDISCDYCGADMDPVCTDCVGKMDCSDCRAEEDKHDHLDPTDHDRLYDQWKDDGGRR